MMSQALHVLVLLRYGRRISGSRPDPRSINIQQPSTRIAALCVRSACALRALFVRSAGSWLLWKASAARTFLLLRNMFLQRPDSGCMPHSAATLVGHGSVVSTCVGSRADVSLQPLLAPLSDSPQILGALHWYRAGCRPCSAQSGTRRHSRPWSTVHGHVTSLLLTHSDGQRKLARKISYELLRVASSEDRCSGRDVKTSLHLLQ